jgi:hypothetical protein
MVLIGQKKCYFMGSVFSSYTLRKKEWAHVQDEESIPASKIEVSWAMGDSVPY